MRFDEMFVPQEGSEFGEWVWCLHCERVSRRTAWEASDLNCPREGCDGGALDAWRWETIREANPQYPQTPEDGGYYPMYPDRSPGRGG